MRGIPIIEGQLARRGGPRLTLSRVISGEDPAGLVQRQAPAELGRYGNRRHRELPAIDQQRGISLSEDGGILIHYSGRQPDKIVFRAQDAINENDLG